MPARPQLIRRFETAPLPDLLEAVKRPTAAEAEAFCQWLGRDRYEALRRRSLADAGQARRTRAARGPKPNAVVLHGIMGAELTVRTGRDEDLVWVNIFRLGLGQISRLKMKADGTPETDSFASGIAPVVFRRHHDHDDHERRVKERESPRERSEKNAVSGSIPRSEPAITSSS